MAVQMQNILPSLERVLYEMDIQRIIIHKYADALRALLEHKTECKDMAGSDVDIESEANTITSEATFLNTVGYSDGITRYHSTYLVLCAMFLFDVPYNETKLATVGHLRVYFDGDGDKLLPFRVRFNNYIRGTENMCAMTAIQIVTEEWMLYARLVGVT